LETAYEELQSTNEELETTNEELQSTNEELETTNEELQSTNEELETMNEELQSTNEELETMNEELRARTDDLNQANAMLEAVLGSVRAAVVVVDNNANVLIWNTWAEELWGLRGDEVRGQSFLTLDIGLPVDELAKPVRACLTGECPYQEILMTARNRRGKAFTCRVALTPFLGVGRAREGAILLMSAQCEDIADTVDRRPESDGAR
jgi:two-component system CheB/CheR fusion protein